MTLLLDEVGLANVQIRPAYKNFFVDYAASLCGSSRVRDNTHNSLSAALLSPLNRVLPAGLRPLSFSMPVGEMLVHAGNPSAV